MNCWKSLLVTSFMLSLALGGVERTHSQAPPTSQVVLAQKGVSYTIPGLRAALLNSDPSVRSMAAGVLAEDKNVQSIPLIRAALEKEEVERVRVTLAAALATLKDWQGSASLIKTCNDEAIDPSVRLLAANRLLDLGSDDCLRSVVGILEGKADPPSRELGMQYLRRTTHVLTSISRRLQHVLIDELNDPVPMNRQYASECISVLGNRNSLVALEEAIHGEKDLPTRTHLEENLQRTKTRLRL